MFSRTITNFEMIKQFHQKFDKNKIPENPIIPSKDIVALREKLITEEFKEVIEALNENDINHIAKELADLLVVTYGTGIAYGIDMNYIFRLVHESNMSKLDDNGNPVYREDGKVMKSKNYKPPMIKLD